MYLEFYRLAKKPFQISADPEFLWLGDKHREALAALRYGVEDNKGFLLLTGDVGTGKTTLINRLLASLEDDVLAATVPDPGLEILDFYRYTAAAFAIEEPFASKGEFLVLFRRFLERAHAAGKKVVLIIDEAQRLTQDLLEEIRLLSNIERPDAKLINIFFVGQNEFNATLLQPENRAIRQRITVNYDLQPLTIEETGRYLQHRLLVAGAREPIFSPAAVQRIHAYSRGYPRLINVIADRCLLTGFVDEKTEITAGMVMECAQELRIPAPVSVAHGQDDAEGNAPLPGPALPAAAGRMERPGTGDPHPKARPAPRTRRRGRRFPAFLLAVLFLAAAAAGGWYAFPRQCAELWAAASATVTRIANRAALLAAGWRATPDTGRKREGDRAGREKRPAGHQPAGDRSAGVRPAEERPAGGQPAGIRPTGDRGRATPSSPTPERRPPTPPPVYLAATTRPASAAAPSPLPEPPPAGREARQRAAPPVSRPLEADIREAPAASPPPAGGEPPPRRPRPADIDPRFLDQTHVISFGHNSNTLSAAGCRLLDKLYHHLTNLPYTRVEIRGYTDNLGTDHYNRQLSLFRANLVKSYLQGKGVPEARIVVSGHGSANPVASNDTREGREKNRRVEITVVR